MLRNTLEVLRMQLETALRAIDVRPEEWVILANAVDPDGRMFERARNKMAMMLVGLQSEPAPRMVPASPAAGDRSATMAPPLYLNARVLFVANFSDDTYGQGLEMLSRTIAFFQQNPFFTRDNAPNLPPEIDKIAMDFVNLTVSETSDLMAMLGLRCMPFALYALRTLPFASPLMSSSGETAETAAA